MTLLRVVLVVSRLPFDGGYTTITTARAALLAFPKWLWDGTHRYGWRCTEANRPQAVDNSPSPDGQFDGLTSTPQSFANKPLSHPDADHSITSPQIERPGGGGGSYNDVSLHSTYSVSIEG